MAELHCVSGRKKIIPYYLFVISFLSLLSRWQFTFKLYCEGNTSHSVCVFLWVCVCVFGRQGRSHTLFSAHNSKTSSFKARKLSALRVTQKHLSASPVTFNSTFKLKCHRCPLSKTKALHVPAQRMAPLALRNRRD